MRLRRLIGQIHLWLGLASGLVVFIVSLTGCLYVFEEEIRAATHADFYYVPPQSRPEITVDEARRIAQNTAPGNPVTQIWRKEDKPGGSFLVFYKNRTVAAIHPYTGAVLGTMDMTRDWLVITEQIHTTLLLGKTGSRIIAWSVVVFVVLLVTGLVLWWPKGKRDYNKSFRIKWGARFKRFNYDLHNVLGFYASLLLLVIALTGLWWSFDSIKEGVYAVIGKPSFAPRPEVATPRPLGGGVLERAYRNALQNRQYAYQTYINLPTEKDNKQALRVMVRYHIPGSFLRNQNIYFHEPATGRLLREDLYRNYNAADAYRATNYIVHTGSILGLPGKLLAFFASLVSTSLPVTGFLIWWGRRKKDKKRPKRKMVSPPSSGRSASENAKPPIRTNADIRVNT